MSSKLDEKGILTDEAIFKLLATSTDLKLLAEHGNASVCADYKAIATAERDGLLEFFEAWITELSLQKETGLVFTEGVITGLQRRLAELKVGKGITMLKPIQCPHNAVTWKRVYPTGYETANGTDNVPLWIRYCLDCGKELYVRKG